VDVPRAGTLAVGLDRGRDQRMHVLSLGAAAAIRAGDDLQPVPVRVVEVNPTAVVPRVDLTLIVVHRVVFRGPAGPSPGNDARLRQWIIHARAADLPHVHSFTRGLKLDIQAVTVALTMPHHNGRTEGVNTKTKMIKRHMYG